MEKIFTSTGDKLFHHGEALCLFRDRQRPTPISLQVALTSRCNLNCAFCSNSNRRKDEQIDFEEYKDTITKLKSLGLKTVEMTGGGDPTMHPQVNDFIRFNASMGLKQGFITNGVALHNLEDDCLEELSWLRISMNCLDYGKKPSVRYFPGVLGFSYVVNEKTTQEVLDHLVSFVVLLQPYYVRLVPNCLSKTIEEQKDRNREVDRLAFKLGKPFFAQQKVFGKPKECWWAYFKPFIGQDGWVYPCSSVVLNTGADGCFHERYRMVYMTELHRLYDDSAKPIKTNQCDHCVFQNQNNILCNLIHKNQMEDFI